MENRSQSNQALNPSIGLAQLQAGPLSRTITDGIDHARGRLNDVNDRLSLIVLALCPIEADAKANGQIVSVPTGWAQETSQSVDTLNDIIGRTEFLLKRLGSFI